MDDRELFRRFAADRVTAALKPRRSSHGQRSAPMRNKDQDEVDIVIENKTAEPVGIEAKGGCHGQRQRLQNGCESWRTPLVTRWG